MTASNGFDPAAALDLTDQARPKLTRVPLRHPPRLAEALPSCEASIPARLHRDVFALPLEDMTPAAFKKTLA